MPRWETPTARRRWTLSTSSLRLKPAGRSNSCWGVGRTSAGLDRQFSKTPLWNNDLECSAIVSARKISQDVLSKYGNIFSVWWKLKELSSSKKYPEIVSWQRGWLWFKRATKSKGSQFLHNKGKFLHLRLWSETVEQTESWNVTQNL